MRILVTGAGGFLGLAIAKLLQARGDTVVGLQRSDSLVLRALQIEQQRGDLGDRNVVLRAAQGCDAVIHVAAKAGHWGRRADYFRTNVLGTQHVLEVCKQLAISRLVYTSTPSVVHAGGDLEGVNESLPYPARFHAHYPASKASAERMVLAANGAQLNTVALRPHLIWGPGDNHLLPRIVERARAGRLHLVGAPKRIDTIYIDNAAHAHVAALDLLGPAAACAGKAYFIAQGEPLDSGEMINRLLDCAGLPPVQRRIAYPLAYAIGALMEWTWQGLRLRGEPLMTRFLANQLATAHWYDLSAARRDLAYAPAVSLATGMARLKASLQAERMVNQATDGQRR
jgi:nucleoside-diphosphate-sugar epimerase